MRHLPSGRAGAAAILAATAIASGVWMASAPARTSGPPSVAQSNALLRGITVGLTGSQLLKSRAGVGPRSYQRGNQPWLYFTVNGDTTVDYVHGFWEAQIVTGLFASAVQARGWTLAGTSISVRDQNGREHVDDEGVFGGLAPVRPAAASTLSALARRALADANLRVADLSFVRPDDRLAVQITAVARNPNAWINQGVGRASSSILRPLAQPAGKSALCEGVLLLVTDASGEWVSVQALAARTLASVQVTNGAFG